MSVSLIGGLLLCLGAYLTMKGRVYLAVGTYIIADFCWIFLSLSKDDLLGTVLIVVGTVLGIVAFIKMKYGIMSRNLNHR